MRGHSNGARRHRPLNTTLRSCPKCVAAGLVGSEASGRSGLEVRMTPAIAFEQTRAIEQSGWTLPDRGRAGVLCLIVTEFTLFSIFVVAYVFYIGRSLTGPTPSQVLDLPVWA